MSGGHWDYCQYRITEGLSTIGNDGSVILRFPKLAQVFRDFSKVLGDIIYELDWDISGDASIKDDREFEQIALQALGKAMRRTYTMRIYEVDEIETTENQV